MTARTRSIVVFLYGFLLLGMPGSALGVAWPSIADDLGRALGDLGILTLVTGLAYGLASASTGALTRRLPAGGLLVFAALSGAASLVILSVGDAWWLLVAAAVPLGLSGGLIDSIGNGYVALMDDARVMGLIHAAFGFGSMVAPLLMTLLAALGMSWRVGFMVLAVAEVTLAIAFLTVAKVIRMPLEGRSERAIRTGSRTLLGLSVWVFFVYAGVEGSTALWAFTLLTEGQGVSDTVAGFAVAAHWGALFASRLLLGVVGDRIPPRPTIAVSAVGVLAGLTLLWWNPSDAVSMIGLVIAGFFSGPVFPLEMGLTPKRFGNDYTPWAVGYQLSAATVSIAIVPATIGFAVNRSGPLVIGAMLTALAVVMVVSVEALRIATKRERADAPLSSTT